MTYETIRKTMAYTSSDVARDYVPAGWTFEGWGDATWCYCSADALPYMKKGWKVAIEDVRIYTGTPEPPPGDHGKVIEVTLHYEDGYDEPWVPKP